MSVWLQPDLTAHRRRHVFSAGRPLRPARIRVGLPGDRAGLARRPRQGHGAGRTQILDGLRDYARSSTCQPRSQRTTVPSDWGDFPPRRTNRSRRSSLTPNGAGSAAPKFPRPGHAAFARCVIAGVGWAGTDDTGRPASRMLLVTLDHMAAGRHARSPRRRVSPLLRGPLSGTSRTLRKCFTTRRNSTVAYPRRHFRLSGAERVCRRRPRYSWLRATHDLRLTRRRRFFTARRMRTASSRHGQPEHAEGAFYVWTQRGDRVRSRRRIEAKIFGEHFGVRDPEGNAPRRQRPARREFTGKNILYVHPARLPNAGCHQRAGACTRLKTPSCYQIGPQRRRPRPHLDDKIITAWNGLMISAFARAAQVLGDPTSTWRPPGARRILSGETSLPRNGGHPVAFVSAEGPSPRRGVRRRLRLLDPGSAGPVYEAGFDIGGSALGGAASGQARRAFPTTAEARRLFLFRRA